MKLGLISDIHGDLRALNRALMLLHERHHVDVIWCAGDLVGRGQQPNEVVARIINGAIPSVLGNHDEFMLMLNRSKPDAHHPVLGYKPETLRMLRTLPRTYRARLEGHNIVMVHGTPRSNSESLSLAPAHQEKALAWLSKIGAQILVAGHTHVPMYAQDKRGLVVNPGSLFDPTGFERSSSESYGVLDITTLTFRHYPLWD